MNLDFIEDSKLEVLYFHFIITKFLITKSLIFSPSEKFWGVQLCANNVFMAAKAAQVLHEIGVDYDFVDLNLGCPLDPIYRMVKA